MLNNEEEQKIIKWLDEIAAFSNLDTQMSFWMTSRKFQWLSTRVVELNDELKENKKLIQTLKDGCRHQGNTYQEVDDGWISEMCSICDALLETNIK